jgi:predicted negative regulator of RcsB-dependent stress response
VRLADLLVERGDLDELHALVDASDSHSYYAAVRLAGLLAERGDLDGAEQILRARAEAGDGDVSAALRLPEVMVKQGRADDAARLRQFGLSPDGSIASA